MKSRLRFLLSAIILFISISCSWGQTQDELNQLQNLSPAQLSTFNVDDLSDAQVQMFMDRLSQSGYLRKLKLSSLLQTRGLTTSCRSTN